MVFVPAGEFWMGCNEQVDGQCSKDEKPYHKVYLDAFYIDKFEVTNGEYNECSKAGRCRQSDESSKTWTGELQPVVGVSWKDAKTYCEWAGKKLPTEARWEKAARGTDGRLYPWGNVIDFRNMNFCDVNCGFSYANKGVNDGYDFTAPVGSYPNGASPYGAQDMAGNVDEWVADRYDKRYYSSSPERNPMGPDSGSSRVFRGGNCGLRVKYERVSSRSGTNGTARSVNIGFRCARDAHP